MYGPTSYGSIAYEATISGVPMCPASPKYEGDTITLIVTPRDGIAPYYVEFRKNSVPTEIKRDKKMKIETAQIDKIKNISDFIKIEGLVEIRNGDTIIKAKNKFTEIVLLHTMNGISWYEIRGGYPATYWYGPTNSPNIYIGTDTITPTTYNTTALTSPIGTAPGTAPYNFTGNTDNPSNGVFRMTLTATWNPGTVSGTVGEMALYLNMAAPPSLQAFQWTKSYGWNYVYPIVPKLASRLAVADGAFSPFTINTSNPLAITWAIKVSFS